MGVVDANVLVLNLDYQPLNVCNVRRAVVLLDKQKAVVIEQNGHIVTSERRSIVTPSVIRLAYHIKRPRPVLKMTRKEVLVRDDHTCQYCGKRGHDLTLDHVIPRHRGGQHIWENVVAACKGCNHKKGPCGSRTWRSPANRSGRRRPRATCSRATSAPASASGSSSWASKTPRPLPSGAGIARALGGPTMRLLFTKRGYSPIGGSESLAYQFATRLAARGNDVRVVCAWPTEKEEVAYRGAAFAPVVHDDHRVFMDRGVEVVQVKPRGWLFGMAADATTTPASTAASAAMTSPSTT